MMVGTVNNLGNDGRYTQQFKSNPKTPVYQCVLKEGDDAKGTTVMVMVMVMRVMTVVVRVMEMVVGLWWLVHSPI